ncbi:hypothetical protein LOZ65_003901 [Ophidiomyces ophidiicola]|nr:hypothetical protein LOZ65_003901 [Ophidiomyces ophidiicola]
MGDSTDIRNVIEAFQALDTGSQKQALQTIAKRVDELRNVLSKSLCFDVIGSMPVELVFQVAFYLEPSEIFIMRMVSKRWNELFSISTACKTSFQSFFPSRNLDTTAPTWEETFTKYAKQHLALKMGRPFSKALFIFARRFNEQASHVTYSSGMVAYQTSGPGLPPSLRVLNLRTSKVMTFSPTHVIAHIRLNEEIVAVVLLNCWCEVWNHQSGKKGTFRLPDGSKVTDFAVDGETVAVSFGYLQVLVWNLNSDVSREVLLPRMPLCLVLDAMEDRLMALYPIRITPPAKTTGKEQNTADNTTSLKAKVTDISSPKNGNLLKIEVPFDLPNIEWRHPLFLNHSGACIVCPQNPLPALDTSLYVGFMTYSKPLQKFLVRTYQNDKLSSRCRCYTGTSEVIVSEEIAYRFHQRADGPFLLILDPRSPEGWRSVRIEGLRILVPASRLFEKVCEVPNGIRGDDKFLVFVYDDGVEVWCFDEDEEYDDDPDYRKEYEKQAAERAAARQTRERPNQASLFQYYMHSSGIVP